MNVLLTGGAGYIGSHIAVELLEDGHDVIVLDNLSNSSEESINRVKEITNKDLKFYKGDIRNIEDIKKVFDENKIDSIIHLAGLKSVNESVDDPLSYYNNNIVGTINLLRAMDEANIKNIIFSSSASVYGKPENVPITEESPVGNVTNPYARTKAQIEDILKDLHASDNDWNIVILRYFNPIGAHESGLIGEDPRNIPANLVPYITQVILGKLPYLNVYGDDYDTPDGTGIRDYIHITDLAKGHSASLKKIEENSGLNIYNLGTGNGYSVLDVLKTFEDLTKKDIPYKIQPRRKGDVSEVYCSTEKANKELGWEAQKDIVDMCRDSLNWQLKNPNGFSK